MGEGRAAPLPDLPLKTAPEPTCLSSPTAAPFYRSHFPCTTEVLGQKIREFVPIKLNSSWEQVVIGIWPADTTWPDSWARLADLKAPWSRDQNERTCLTSGQLTDGRNHTLCCCH